MYYTQSKIIFSFIDPNPAGPNQLIFNMNTAIPSNISADDMIAYITTQATTALDSGLYKDTAGNKISSTTVKDISTSIITGSTINFIDNQLPLTALYIRK